MSCPEFDWKAYTLGEADAAARRAMEEHLLTCGACREEVRSLQVTVSALKRVPAQEPPRRIAFVSDPVFEPGWWHRFLHSGPRLAFASAAMLSLAIVAHALVMRPAPAPVATLTPAEVEERVAAELNRRLPEAVRQTVRVELQPALADLRGRIDEMERTRLAGIERKVEQQRMADLRNLESAFSLIEKRLNTMVTSNARYGGD